MVWGFGVAFGFFLHWRFFVLKTKVWEEGTVVAMTDTPSALLSTGSLTVGSAEEEGVNGLETGTNRSLKK